MRRLILAGITAALVSTAQAEERSYIEIDLSEQTLAYHAADTTITYPVAVGMDDYPTPTGEFSIRSIDKQPSWCPDPDTEWLTPAQREYVTANGCIPYWDPLNPFTRYRLRFNGAYSIHGTKYANVGRQESHGCVRMAAKDITALVEQHELQKGTRVIIHE